MPMRPQQTSAGAVSGGVMALVQGEGAFCPPSSRCSTLYPAFVLGLMASGRWIESAAGKGLVGR
uniref:Uncharacterized protein n=1 Tax=Tetraselmis sp. GSL018 TaxID=582737 RepID=A0A061RMT5_9CHLO